eukprot:6381007-Prymnesium_polylepis.1
MPRISYLPMCATGPIVWPPYGSCVSSYRPYTRLPPCLSRTSSSERTVTLLHRCAVASWNK